MAAARPRNAATLAALLLLSLAGCAIHDYQPQELPAFMRDGQSPAAVEVAPAPRPALGAPMIAPGAIQQASLQAPILTPDLPPPGLTLDEAIDACLRNDPKLHAGREAIEQAKADLLTSSLLPNPTLNTDVQLLPLGRSFTVDRQGGPPQFDAQLGFPVDWFLFGKRAAAIASNKLGVEVSAADFADLIRQRVAATITAYYDVLEAQALLKLAEEDLSSLRRVEGITGERVKLGGVGSVELDRVRLSVFEAQREVRRREVTLIGAQATLRSLMGRADADSAFTVGGTLDVPSPALPPTPAEALALAELARPDLVSLRRQLAKAEADIHVEQTKAWPTVTPGVLFTRQFQEKAIGFPDASSYGGNLSVTVPVFDRNQGNIRKAQSSRVQVSFNLQAQVVSLRAEIEQAANEFRIAHQNVTTEDRRQLETARSVRDRIEAAYKLGGRPLLELLDAERAYRETARSFVTSQSSYWHTLHKLNAAVGRQVLR